MDRLRRRVPAMFPEPAPNPFQTLALQERLSRLAGEINALDRQSGREFAGGHHARAARLAYEQTLDEACRLVGVPVEENGPTHQLMAEARLLHAGWTW